MYEIHIRPEHFARWHGKDFKCLHRSMLVTLLAILTTPN